MIEINIFKFTQLAIASYKADHPDMVEDKEKLNRLKEICECVSEVIRENEVVSFFTSVTDDGSIKFELNTWLLITSCDEPALLTLMENIDEATFESKDDGPITFSFTVPGIWD